MSRIEPAEHDYLVVVEHTFTYRVSAETPEEAAAVIDQGEYECAEQQEVIGSHVERVVAASGSWTDDDLRGPKKCAGGCGKKLAASDQNECTPCFLDRLRTERIQRVGAGQ
jgi:hypothetical protein